MIQTSDFKSLQNRVVASKYPLVRWLGGSTLTAVFETEIAGRKAAIKLGTQETSSKTELEQLRRVSKLSHPNLITIFDCGSCEFDGAKFVYVVMEFAEEDLSQILPQRPLTPTEARDFLQPALSALSDLHEKGFVHGRIRPSNILAAGDCIKLSTDFVLRSARERDAYDAPESASGALSIAADVWGIGATVLGALTQQPPMLDGGGQLDPKIPSSMPEPFRTMVRDCLRRNPAERCTIPRIAGLLRGDAATERNPSTVSVPSGRRPTRALIISGVIVALIMVLFLAFHFSRSSSGQAENAAIESTPSTLVAPPASQANPVPTQAANNHGSVLHKVLPDVPKGASHTIHGHIKVAVRVMVDGDGKVTSEKLVTAGPSHYFANLAERAAEKWEFTPPVSNGQPAPSTWLLRFQFSRKSTEAFPTQERH